MKPLLLIFALALLFPLGQSSFLKKVESLAELQSESTQDWTPIDTNEAQTDTDIKANLDYGVQQLLKTLLSQQKITSADYQLTKVVDAKKQNSGKTINYQFQVELSNGQGTTIKATFTVNYKATGERTLGAYSWSMQTKVITSKSVEANENAWIEVSLSELQGDANISGALQFAIDNSIKSAVQKGELAGDRFDISSIKKCYKQTVSGYTFFKFDVDLSDNGGTEITLSATVVVNLKTGERVLRAYNYVATTTLYAERVKLVNSIDGYSKVTTTELSSTLVKTAQSYGIQIIISAVLGEGKIKDGSFQVTKVNNCYKRVVNDWTFYKFEVSLTNSQGAVITATFTVRCNNKTGVQEIAGFNYNVSGQTSTDSDDSNAQYIVVDINDAQKDAETQNALSQCVSQLVSKAGQSTTFKVTKLTSVYKKILSTGIHFKFEAEAQDDEGTTLTFSCTVRYNVKTGKCELLAYNYKITQASQEAGQYTSIDVSQAQSNKEVQTVVNFAIAEVVKKVSSKVSNVNFSVSKYNSIQRSSNAKYAFYQCNLELSNGAGATVTTTFTVRLTLKTGACELTSFTYNLTNKKTSTATESDVSDDDEDGGTYTTVSETSITTDKDVKTCAEFGVQEIIKKVLTKKTIENTDFTISKVNSVQKKVSGGYTTCAFNVELSNGEGWTITATFTVRCDTKSGKCTLKSYKYNYNYNSNWTDSISWTDVDVTKISSDSGATSAANFGIKSVIEKFTAKSGLTFENYSIQQYNSVQKRVTKTYTFYKFDLVLVNNKGITIYCTFSVQVNLKSGQSELTSYNYRWVTKKVSTATESDVEDADEEAGNYVELTSDKLTTDKDVQLCVNWGTQEIINKVLKKNTISNTDFQVSKVTSIKKKVTASWIYCYFTLELSNGEGGTITTTFTVRCDAKTGKCVLKSYKYKYNYNASWSDNLDYSDLDVNAFFEDEYAETAATYAIEEIIKKFSEKSKLKYDDFQVEEYNSGKRKTTKNYIFYKFDLNIADTTGITIYLTCSVKYNIKTGACELTSWNYRYTYKKVSTATESDVEDADEESGNYVDLSSDSLTNDKDVRNCASFGIQEIITKVTGKNKVSNTNFQVSQVVSVRRKVTASWIYCYFTLELSNGEGGTITTTFTVRCDAKTGKCVLKSYKYKYNYNANWADTGDWTDLDVTKISSDTAATNAANFGIKYVVEKFTSSSKLSFDAYWVQQYNTVQKRATASFTFYKFDLVLTNNKGIIVYATFTVKVTNKSNQSEVTAYNYRWVTKKVSTDTESDVEDADEESGNYVELTSDKLTSDKDVKLCVTWGVQEIINKVLKKNTISNSDFQISQVVSVRKKVTASWTYCYFSLVLSNGEGGTITTTFTVRCDTKSGKCVLKSYKYKYNYDANWADSGEYTDVDTTKIASDAQATTAANFGIKEIVSKFVAKAGVSFNNYYIQNYNSVQRKLTKSYAFYKFDVDITNGGTYTIFATFTIKVTLSSGKCELTSWNYKYSTKKVSTEDESDLSDSDEEDGTYNTIDTNSVTTNSETKTAVNFGISQISAKVAKKKNLSGSSATFTISKVNSIKRKTTLRWVYYRFDLVLINNEGWTITCTFTIRCNPKNNACTLKAYKYKATYTEPAPQKITASDVDKDADMKAAMEWGVNQVMTNLKSTGVVSSMNFQVTKVEEGGEVKRSKDGNTYTFNLELTGPYNFVVKISITVYHNTKTNTRTLTSWKLRGTSGVVSAAKSAVSSAVSSVSKWLGW